MFPSGTLGQEREVVQQLQEGLVDFMVSGTAIWGSVAPKLQLFDFPFLWRDWDHVHGVVDGPVGREAADYMEAAVARPAARLGRLVRLPPGDHALARRHRARPSSPGLKLRTIQSPIYVKAVELMGASPTPMAFGEVYTSLQTGVIDGYEHDAEHDPAAALLRGRALHGAHAPHRRRAGPLRLGGRAWQRLPAELRAEARGRGPRGRAPPARDGSSPRTGPRRSGSRSRE